jgi:hypothetical protein
MQSVMRKQPSKLAISGKMVLQDKTCRSKIADLGKKVNFGVPSEGRVLFVLLTQSAMHELPSKRRTLGVQLQNGTHVTARLAT